MYKKIVLLIITSFICYNLAAQRNGNSSGEVHARLAYPLKEFANVNEGAGPFWGLGIGFYFQPFEYVPVTIVPYISYFGMGREFRYFEKVDGYGEPYEVDYELVSSMIPVECHLRLDPIATSDFPVLPYVGVYGGFRVFSSKETVTTDYLDGSEPIEESPWLPTHLGFRLCAGLEGGIKVRVHDNVWVDIRAERSIGGKASYIDMSSVTIDDFGIIDYNMISSRTDMMVFTLGVFVNIS